MLKKLALIIAFVLVFAPAVQGATEILQKTNASIALGVSGSFNPADDGTNFTDDLITIDFALTLNALADTAGRHSIKFDLGATRARQFSVLAAVDFTGETPTAGEVVEYYWCPSTDSTQAEGNIAGNSGADAAAPDGALGSITLAEFAKLCLFIGNLIVHDGGSVQNGYVGRFSPPERFGQILVINESGDAFEADDVEAHTVLVPIVDELQ